ncbi:D-alanyl-D-alanine carboxypeptidase family protein [Marinilactibacillus psychrotolerans]|uniref:D-alanyl-D-alanine carboxypeptidase family protein n=1 Tax=Marinilactibacillus psychrotolerans TaxID=191770 RepID=UPI0018682077|nr:serine hydrolase [Marinilactibacillus psychrotolerans]
MKKIKRFIQACLLGAIIVVPIIFMIGDKHDTQIHEGEYVSPHIYMMNRKTNTIMYKKVADTLAYPASLTKIMTAIIAIEQIDSLSDLTKIDENTYSAMIEANSSMAGVSPSEEVTYADLLYGTILSSGGEAANSLAVSISGNVDHFVQLMNIKAAELKLKNTHFMNPEGLHHENQYTTASDMAKLLDYALDNEQFKKIFTTETYITTSTSSHPNGIYLSSTVLKQVKEAFLGNFSIIGGKSGTTYQAGQNWATLGVIDGEEYISIVMGAPLNDLSHPDRAQIEDTVKLYENTWSSLQ